MCRRQLLENRFESLWITTKCQLKWVKTRETITHNTSITRKGFFPRVAIIPKCQLALSTVYTSIHLCKRPGPMRAIYDSTTGLITFLPRRSYRPAIRSSSQNLAMGSSGGGLDRARRPANNLFFLRRGRGYLGLTGPYRKDMGYYYVLV